MKQEKQHDGVQQVEALEQAGRSEHPEGLCQNAGIERPCRLPEDLKRISGKSSYVWRKRHKWQPERV